MEKKKKLPVGIENFREFLTNDFYYVDKTGLIEELLDNWGKVNLFTRPRRFGKSLNMDMLKSFFEIGCDKSLFDGLAVAGKKELCETYMGQFPVVSVSLKSVEGPDYEEAYKALCFVIYREAKRFSFLETSGRLTESERENYHSLVRMENGFPYMPWEVLVTSLQTLLDLLTIHFGKKVILLIDEYDVPLEKAFQTDEISVGNSYYKRMTLLLRSLLGNVLKTNENLYFAVLTGCLRISKESIFTGLNNFKMLSITDNRYSRYFGFTDGEVREMLDYYDLSDQYGAVKDWYDGYRFGETSVYCPWDVINYCDEARFHRDMHPKSYWINTSGNNIIRSFINRASGKTRREIEKLIAGEAVWKEIRMELTYSELYKNMENFWSVLFMTGYLTWSGKEEGERYQLSIPNREIRQIFVSQVREWFSDTAAGDIQKVNTFCRAFEESDIKTAEELLPSWLRNTISIRDTSVPQAKKENFYHGILLGLFLHKEDWNVFSNAESGDGYSDILIEIDEKSVGIIIEVKYAEKGELEDACVRALRQIREKNYEERLIDDGMETILKYGIACYKKRCRIVPEVGSSFSGGSVIYSE